MPPSSKFIANFKALLSTTSVYLFQKDIAIHYFNLQNAAKLLFRSYLLFRLLNWESFCGNKGIEPIIHIKSFEYDLIYKMMSIVAGQWDGLIFQFSLCKKDFMFLKSKIWYFAF